MGVVVAVALMGTACDAEELERVDSTPEDLQMLENSSGRGKEDRAEFPLRLDDVGRLTTSVAKVRPFIVTRDWRPSRELEAASLRAQLVRPPEQGDLFA